MTREETTEMASTIGLERTPTKNTRSSPGNQRKKPWGSTHMEGCIACWVRSCRELSAAPGCHGGRHDQPRRRLQ